MSTPDRTSPNFGDQLNKTLHGREYERCVQDLQRDNLIWLIDYLDDVSLPVSYFLTHRSSRHKLSIVSTLPVPLPGSVYANSGTYAGHTMLPTSHVISADLLTVDSQPFTSGGFCEMHCGTLSGSAVCVKRLPVYSWGISPKDNKVRY